MLTLIVHVLIVALDILVDMLECMVIVKRSCIIINKHDIYIGICHATSLHGNDYNENILTILFTRRFIKMFFSICVIALYALKGNIYTLDIVKCSYLAFSCRKNVFLWHAGTQCICINSPRLGTAHSNIPHLLRTIGSSSSI